MRKSLLFVITALCVLCLSAGKVAAQQQNQLAPEPPALTLEITSFIEKPIYSLVGKGFWSPRYPHMESWRPPVGSTPVKAVRVASSRREDVIEIKISVLLGERFHDREEPVATYHIREGETIKTDEVTRFGIRSFAIRVINVLPSLPSLPTVTNRTTSIAVVNVEQGKTPFPSFTLSLRNISNKSILNLNINIISADGGRMRLQPHNLDDSPLIEPGDTYRTGINVEGGRLTADGLLPDSPRTFIIRAALFTDGTYEGDVEPAADMKAVHSGRKIQIKRVITLFSSALEATDLSAQTILENFKTQVSALDDNLSPAAIDELLAEFPTLNQTARKDFPIVVSVGLHSIRNDLLADLKKFEQTHAPQFSVGDFQAWLAATKEGYEKRFARFE
jgi:hypothetical protein